MTLRVLLSTATLALVLASPATADESLSIGSLKVDLGSDPWGIAIRDAGGPVITELGATGGAGSNGSLGFSVGDQWFHTTRATSMLRDGNTVSATLATNDPLGRTIRVHVKRDGDGIVAVEASVSGGVVSRVGIGFRGGARGERYLGFGERGNAVDQRGNVVENFVSDGPYLESERPLIAGFVPPQGYSPRDDATYFPIPWLVSTHGYGVLVDNDERSFFRLGTDSPGTWSAEVEAGRLSFRVFAGPSVSDVVARFSKRLGRQPKAAAPFFFGPWFQPKGGDAQSIDTLRKADVPSSVANTYTHYLPCADQEGKTAEQRSRTKLFHDNGIAVTTYFNPMICSGGGHPQFDAAAAQGALTKNAAGAPYTYKYTGSTQFLVGQFDFSTPIGSSFFQRLLQESVDDGYDGWMEDFGEYTPSDSVPADTTYDGAQMHNRYATLYHESAHAFSKAAPRALARFNRSGWTGTARHSQIVWGGDPTTDWGFDGLSSSIKQGLTMGLSGVSTWGSDIGGYFTIAAPQLSSELLKRWIQFGFASGVMRTEANGFVVGDKGVRPQIFDADVLPIWRRYAKLRTQLYPYLRAADEEYARTGMPIMRHLSLAFPGDDRAAGSELEYMFGPDLLAAPVVEPGAKTRELYVPRGRWFDFWRSASFVSGDGSLRLERARPVAGGRRATLRAPLEELPMLVRAGAILPLLPPDVDTLAEYGKADPSIDTLSERDGEVRLIVFPYKRSVRRSGDMRWVSSESAGRWTLVANTRVRRTFEIQASMASLARPIKPCSVSVDGKPLSRRAWRFDARRRVLRASFAGRGALRLVASACVAH